MTAPKRQRAISFRPSSALRQWLRLGSVVRAVVLHPLGANTAVINVRGVNTVAASPLPLARGQVLYATVADIGEQVHLRLVPPPAIEEASHATTTAELVRHLASIGIEPTDGHVGLAASMLTAGLPITPEHFAAVARLAQETDGDPDATGAAAAYVVRHGLEQDPTTAVAEQQLDATQMCRTVAAVRVALFEPPSLGELLAVLEAGLSSGRVLPGTEELQAGVRRCLGEIRAGGPVEWLGVSARLCGVDCRLPSESTDLSALLGSSLSDDQALAQAAQPLRTLLRGLHAVNAVPALGGAKRWVLQVPFLRGDTVGTSLVELEVPDGPLDHAVLAGRSDARLWVPLEESVVRARLRVRDGRATAALHFSGTEEADAAAACAEWLRRVLPEFGIELSHVSAGTAGEPAAAGPAEQPAPAVGLDFEV